MIGYGTPYTSASYMQELQNMKDRIDSQLRQYQQNQNQPQMPQPITQNFQLAPNTPANELDSKFAANIDEVKNTFVMKTGIFLTRDFSTLWVKDVTGKIRTFTTEEIIEMDEKDKQIYELRKQIEEMKGMIANGIQCSNSDVDESTTDKKSARLPNNSKSNTK